MTSAGSRCMYARSMGSPFRSLPWAIRLVHADSEWRLLVGRATVRRGRSLLSRLAGWLFGFPPALTAAPCRVEFRGSGPGERWWRRFDGHPMTSVLSFEDGRLYESFGPLKCELECVKRGLALVIRCRRAWLLGVPLPARLVPQVIASEKERDGKFLFRVHIRLPIAGLIAAYRGTLDTA
jgi:hypothetical protein